MPAVREETMDVRSDEDVMRVRQVTRQWAIDLGFSLIDQTKIVTAASELARNALVHGGGGLARVEVITSALGKNGVRVGFTDEGPGITDLDLALTDGWSSGVGLGLGLSGARRLVDEFELTSKPGTGTSVVVIKWSR